MIRLLKGNKSFLFALCIFALFSITGNEVFCADDSQPNLPPEFNRMGMPKIQDAAGVFEYNPDKSWDSDACDEDFMNTIFMNSWMHAQADMVFDHSIRKMPQSVFELTCFASSMGVAGGENEGEGVGAVFSETQELKEVTVSLSSGDSEKTGFARDAGNLRESLQRAVLTPLNTYIDTNFEVEDKTGVTDIDSPPYVCSRMLELWMLANCKNFDNVYDLDYFVNGGDDLRYPREGESCGNHHITQEMHDLSINKDFQYASYDEAKPTELNEYWPTPADAGMDTVNLRISDSYAKAKSAGDSCPYPPIPVVLDYQKDSGDDGYSKKSMVCPNIGCYYDGSSCVPVN